MSSLEALLFIVRGLLDRVVARLAMSSLACSGLTISLGLEDGSEIERTVGVLAPTRDVKTLALLTRSALEAAPPHAAIEAVRVVALPDRPRADQLDLFRPAGPPPAQLATTLARLAALCGPAKVGRAVPPAGHRPDAFRLVPFGVDLAPRAARPVAARRSTPVPGPQRWLARRATCPWWAPVRRSRCVRSGRRGRRRSSSSAGGSRTFARPASAGVRW